MVQPLHIKNAFVWDGHNTIQRDLYTSTDGRIADKSANGALVVDLDGYTIFPGLINAHDHLELNHYPRSKFRERYDNAHQWGEDMNVRLDSEPYKSLRAYPLEDKLFIGGLKNLLCGATTVAHHGPPHKPMFRQDFPVRVLQKYGWAHSLHFDTDEQVRASYLQTPPDVPWMIHLAEGTDEIAAGELKRLQALRCVGKNTVLVHGVGLIEESEKYSTLSKYNVVTCPSTNFYLLGQPLDTFYWILTWNIALGSDSRLTAEGDLLDEMRLLLPLIDPGAAIITGNDYREAACVLAMVTLWAALILRSDAGDVGVNANADFIAIRKASDDEVAMCKSRRSDLALVVFGGVPQIGDPDIMAKFPHVETVPATLDGRPKAIQRKLAERIWKCTLKERGLEVDEPPRRKYILF